MSSLRVPWHFGRSVNPISTRGERLCPPYYDWRPRIFRRSDGPVHMTPNIIGSIICTKKRKNNILKKIYSMKGLVSLRFLTSKDPIIRNLGTLAQFLKFSSYLSHETHYHCSWENLVAYLGPDGGVIVAL